MNQENDRRNHRRKWRPEETAYIWQHRQQKSEVLALKFGRSKAAIDAVKQKLKEQHEQTKKIFIKEKPVL